MTSLKRFLTANEAAEFLSISISHLYKHTHQKAIRYYKPNGRKIYFKLSDLENFILGGEVRTQEEIEQDAINLLNKV